MKKVLILLATFLFTISLSACGNNNSRTSNQDSSSQTTQKHSHKKRITKINTKKESDSQQTSSSEQSYAPTTQTEVDANSKSEPQTWVEFVKKYKMTPVNYKMQHQGMSKRQALETTPKNMKSPNELQAEYVMNHPNAYQDEHSQTSTDDSSSDSGSYHMTKEEASQYEEGEYKANEYQRSPDGQWYHVDRDGSSQKIDGPPQNR
ncbi:hypothetical protein EFN12_03910 [Pediococcus pentosaceus]|uniref:hypothetical protein n=1 Tax=Pediococcus pentosaceus TaxID=1255 RepID=UPI0021A86A1C|nr:hypothetical protein [Pediococcus pentosaceus]MCT3023767.1 hypothetical protein [Pediococcus pentosaceus]